MPDAQVSNSSGLSSSSSSSRTQSGSFSGPHLLYYASGGVDPSTGQYQHPGLYNQRYADSLALNASLYDNYLQGYSDVLDFTASGTDRVAAGYAGLGQGVQGMLQGAEASERQRIADNAARQTADARQQLINAGLGDTTIGVNVNRGIESDRLRAETALANQFAQTRAGYAADIGSRGLASTMQGLGLMGNLAQTYMGSTPSFRMQPPDWAPNYTRSDSSSASDSTQTSQQLSSSVGIGAPDISAPGAPRGLNAGTPGPLYSPQGIAAIAAGSSYGQTAQNAVARAQGISSPYTPPGVRANALNAHGYRFG